MFNQANAFDLSEIFNTNAIVCVCMYTFIAQKDLGKMFSHSNIANMLTSPVEYSILVI